MGESREMQREYSGREGNRMPIVQMSASAQAVINLETFHSQHESRRECKNDA